MGVATGSGFKEIYRFPHTTYPYSSCICNFLQQYIYIIIIHIQRGSRHKKVCVGGGQTPKIIQAPIFLAFLMTRSYHYLQKSGGNILPLLKKWWLAAAPLSPPFPTSLIYIYLQES